MVRPSYSSPASTLSFHAHSPEVVALCAIDEDFGTLVGRVGEVSVDIEGNAFISLARAIVDQQISMHAARAIWGRFESLCGGLVTAESVLEFDVDTLRTCGLSNSKCRYLLDLAARTQNGSLDFGSFAALDDESIISELTAVKGVGRWTAQMYLIFALERLDVFAVDDGGLRRAVCALKGLEANVPKELIEDIASDWAPYRTVAALYLWRGLGQP